MKKRTKLVNFVIYMIIGEAVILILAAQFLSYLSFRKNATSIYEELDRSITGAALYLVDEDEMAALAKNTLEVFQSFEDPKREFTENREAYLAKFSEIENSEPYQRIRAQVNDMRRNTVSTCITYVLLIPGEDIGIYVFDSSDVNVLPCGELFDIDTQAYVGNPSERPFDSFITTSTTYGLVRTDGVPCCTAPSDGIYSYLLADIPISNVTAKTISFLQQTGFGSLFLLLIICFGAAGILRQKLVKPVHQITEKSKHYVAACQDTGTLGGTQIFQDLKEDEIVELNELTSSLKQMELNMNEYHKNLEHMTAERTRIGSELELAERIQMNMLPSIFPAFPERSEFDLLAVMNPALEVGGDFYDFFLIDDDHLGLVIADVSGKGIPGALFMMMSKILIKNRLLDGDSPAEVLEAVNNTICQNNDNEMFVTVWLAVMTISTGSMICSNAGHEYPIISRDGQPYEVLKDHHGFVVGSVPDMKYKNYELQLHNNDTLFVYTDGLPEAANPAFEQFGIQRILDVLNSNLDADLQEVFMDLTFANAEFVEDAPQFDDITMLAVRGRDIPGDHS